MLTETADDHQYTSEEHGYTDDQFNQTSTDQHRLTQPSKRPNMAGAHGTHGTSIGQSLISKQTKSKDERSPDDEMEQTFLDIQSKAALNNLKKRIQQKAEKKNHVDPDVSLYSYLKDSSYKNCKVTNSIFGTYRKS